MLTRMELLPEKLRTKLEGGLTVEENASVDVAHYVYQGSIAAYGHEKNKTGRRWVYKVLRRTRIGLPEGAQELGQLGRSMRKRRDEILAYFDHGASNGQVEAINGRVEHLRRIALGFESDPLA